MRAMPFTEAPVTTSIPDMIVRFSRSDATSRSTPGTRPGVISRMVTRVPMAARNWANSTPMTPPPITTTLAGRDVRLRTCFESSTSGPSIPSTGIEPGFEPVAMSIASARIFTPVSLTCTVFESTKVAVPCTTFIFPAFRRAPTPRVSLDTTESLRFMTAPKSTS